MAVFWVVAPCSLVEVYQHFRGPCCLHHQALITLMMEAARTSETLVNFYQIAWCNNPEDSHLRTLCHENLKSYFEWYLSACMCLNLKSLVTFITALCNWQIQIFFLKPAFDQYFYMVFNPLQSH
jgi:hypothetical protein